MAKRALNAIAVFCGSNFGSLVEYTDAAKLLGSRLAKEDITLIYGGTTKGLMGVIADATLADGGRVHGVVTESLHGLGQSHLTLSKHEITKNLRLRKQRMIELADAFVVMPGGLGTLEELMEVWSMNQLKEIDKPIGLLNTKGFFSNFIAFINHMIESEFLPTAHLQTISLDQDPANLLEQLRNYSRIDVPKWINAGNA
jgi:uncharacterized protein (TIGR00730 family)